MREERREKRREKREGGVNYIATCCHALCCPVLWIYIYTYFLFEGCDLLQCFFATCSCFKHFININKNIYKNIYIDIYTCMCIYMCVCVCVCVCVCGCVCVCLCVCVFVLVLVYVFVTVCCVWLAGLTVTPPPSPSFPPLSPVCPSKKPPCVDSKRQHVYRHHARMW